MQDPCTFPVFVAVWNRLQGQSTPALHFKIARWIYEAWINGRKRLLLLAFRSCGKSSLIGLFCVWLFWRDPNLRILVVAADHALAHKMVRQVKRIIERHPFTKSLKPRNSDQWGNDRFTLARTREWRDPSMLAKGIGSNLTGTRADLIICDDVEVPKTSDTNAKREELRTRLMELDYILTPEGTQIYVGTPHHYETIYRHKGDEEAFLKGFDHLTIPIVNDKGQSVWPERFPLPVIEAMKLKTGPYHFQSQMMVEPVNRTHGRFDMTGLQIYQSEIEFLESNQTCQLSIAGEKMVSCVAWWDPAFAAHGRTSDQSILAILYANEDHKFYVHHIASLAASSQSSEDEATQQCQQVARLLKEFHVPLVAIETNGLGKFLPSILRREIARIRGGAHVQEITARRSKSLRILEAFDVVLAARSLYVHQSILRTGFKRQLSEWSPALTNADDDMIDAVAGALSLQPARFKFMGALRGQRPQWMGHKPTIISQDTFNI
jgi:hypothetical protein